MCDWLGLIESQIFLTKTNKIKLIILFLFLFIFLNYFEKKWNKKELNLAKRERVNMKKN